MRVRELDGELDIKSPKLWWRYSGMPCPAIILTVSVEQHYALVTDGAVAQSARDQHTRCDGLPRHNLDVEPSIVEMLDEDSAARQGRHKLDLALVGTDRFPSGKPRVRLLGDVDNDIAGLDVARPLVAVAPELDARATLDAAVDVELQDLRSRMVFLPMHCLQRSLSR